MDKSSLMLSGRKMKEIQGSKIRSWARKLLNLRVLKRGFGIATAHEGQGLSVYDQKKILVESIIHSKIYLISDEISSDVVTVKVEHY